MLIGYCYKYTRATYDWFCGPGSHIMISEISCDTEDWSNNAENSALHQRNKLKLSLISINLPLIQMRVHDAFHLMVHQQCSMQTLHGNHLN